MSDPAEIAAAARRDAASGVAVAVIGADGAACIEVVSGLDEIREDSPFELASISKTMTALVLAQLVLAGSVELSTPLGDVLGAGPNASITLRELATHSSGLPRLPSNLVTQLDANPHARFDDPYACYSSADLVAALHEDIAGSKSPEYSNFGYMVLAHALSTVTGRGFADLLRELVFRPLGMTTASIAHPAEVEHMVSGYRDGVPVSHWTKLVAGPGGVIASIRDLTAYLRAQLRPESTDLEIAIEMTQAVGPDGERLG